MSVATELMGKGYDPDVVRSFSAHGVDLRQAFSIGELGTVLDEAIQQALEDYDECVNDEAYVLQGGVIGRFKDAVLNNVLRKAGGESE
ncbi:hypothetical protein DXB68_10240 [Bifidobacterium longum]|uniref:hypothetical protein n=1 Tax=Bifidobacterium longum TaxID=216816 RepID=UPI000E453607|nr:hypothetical protein [Bifidobacterium longum]RGN23158.1 hypothetical protein DXB68_10240 [Bifidobacterium longum]